MLHLENDTFRQFVNKISIESGIDTDILEKDYYVCLILKELAESQDTIKAYFKGGTAVYKILPTMNRFSEDIDLTVEVISDESNNKNKTRLEKSALGYKILGLELIKEECINNKGSVTAVYRYKSAFDQSYMPLYREGKIQVESTSFTISEPTEKYTIEPIIYKLADDSSKKILKEKFNISEFDIRIIKLERIFTDKVFATEFYYLRKMYADMAKHIYDIFNLYNNEIIRNLLKDTKEFSKLIDYKRQEEIYRKGGIDFNTKLSDFTYLALDYSDEFIKEFNNMQEKYVLNEKFKVSIDDAKKVLINLKEIFITNNL